MLVFEIPGKPSTQHRHRTCIRGDRTISYDPDSHEKEQIKWLIRSQFNQKPLACPIAIKIDFYFPVPKGTSHVKKMGMLCGIIPYTKKPDIDNLEKKALDVLSEIVYEDDRQVFEMSSRKLYGEVPKTMIYVQPFTH